MRLRRNVLAFVVIVASPVADAGRRYAEHPRQGRVARVEAFTGRDFRAGAKQVRSGQTAASWVAFVQIFQLKSINNIEVLKTMNNSANVQRELKFSLTFPRPCHTWGLPVRLLSCRLS